MGALAPRCLTAELGAARATSPAVLIAGPRHAGKRTAAQAMGHSRNVHPTAVEWLDACTVAARDAEGYLRRLSTPILLHDVHAMPALWEPLRRVLTDPMPPRTTKTSVRFLLTSSADPNALPALAKALEGLAKPMTLYPLSAGESLGVREGFVKAMFSTKPAWPQESLDRRPWHVAMAHATFPALAAVAPNQRAAWFEQHLTTVLNQDARTLMAVEKVAALLAVFTGLASRVGEWFNEAARAREVGLNAVTFRRYRALLNALFLLLTVPAWSRAAGRRLVKAPRIYMTDTALLCHLRQIDPATLLQRYPAIAKGILENFVASELTKQLARPEALGTLGHWATYDGRTVEFVIEQADGRLAAAAVKPAETVVAHDFSAIQALRAMAGPRFVRGVVLYLGARTVSFGNDLHALPLSSLWMLGAKPLSP